MTVVYVLLGALTLLAAAATFATEIHAPRGKKVVVNTRRPDDQAIEGVLVRETRRRLILEQAAYVTADGATPIVGRAHVYRENVAFVQERV